MKSPVVKRSIVIAGHKTSVSLEDAFWKGLKEIANGRELTLSDLWLRSTLIVAMAICHPQFAFSFSTITVCILSTTASCTAILAISQARAALCTQFCVPTEAAGGLALRGAGAGFISIGAGNAGAGLFGGAAFPRNCDGALSIARNVFV